LQTVRHCFNFYANSYECCLGAMTRRWEPTTRYTLRRNTVSIMKGLVFRLDVTRIFFLSIWLRRL